MDCADSRKNEQEQSKEKVLIIANPSSSGGSTRNDWEDLHMKLEQAFGENGSSYEIGTGFW